MAHFRADNNFYIKFINESSKHILKCLTGNLPGSPTLSAIGFGKELEVKANSTAITVDLKDYKQINLAPHSSILINIGNNKYIDKDIELMYATLQGTKPNLDSEHVWVRFEHDNQEQIIDFNVDKCNKDYIKTHDTLGYSSIEYKPELNSSKASSTSFGFKIAGMGSIEDDIDAIPLGGPTHPMCFHFYDL